VAGSQAYLARMHRLVWMVLNDGRSVVAGCGGTSNDSLADAFSRPDSMLMLASHEGVQHISCAAIRDYVLLDSNSNVPPSTSIYRLVHV
jgi:hypothetical protein